MSIVTRLLGVAAIAVFLLACVYAGYINEQLKAAVSPAHCGVVMIGFIIGAGAVARYVMSLNDRLIPRKSKRR